MEAMVNRTAKLRLARLSGKFPLVATALGALMLSVAGVEAQNPVQKWKVIEADNGQRFAIDLNSIAQGINGGANAITCALDNGTCLPGRASRIIFDCRGHYIDVDHGGVTAMAPPRSVVGQFAETACANSKSTRDNSASAGSSYKARYVLAGFLLRASAVCENDAKRTISAGFGLLETAEIKAISKAYPETIQIWMAEGSNNFNNGVMTDGIQIACAFAFKVRDKAEETASSDHP